MTISFRRRGKQAITLGRDAKLTLSKILITNHAILLYALSHFSKVLLLYLL